MRCLLSIALVASIGCAAAESSDAPCVAVPASDCGPLYEPTWDNVYERTIVKRCALAGGACHAAEGAQGDLVLEGKDVAFAALVDEGRVVAGDVSCSLLYRRVGTDDRDLVMPPQSPMSGPERCAIATWIAALDSGGAR